MFGFKNLKRINRKVDIEPQEILLDRLAKEKEEELGISEKRFEVPLPQNVLKFLYLVSVIIIFFFLFRTFQLQIIQGKEFSTLSEENKFLIYQIRAERGVIYDKSGEQLVFNKPSFNLVCSKKLLPEKEEEKEKVLKEVAEILKESQDSLKEKIESNSENKIIISENLSHQELIVFETKIKEFPGFSIEQNSVREYKDGEIFSHLIGYTGKITSEEYQREPEMYSLTDRVGRNGLELFYEEFLRKNPGKLRIKRDALGNIVSKEIIEFPESGKSLILYLDANLQRKITQILKEKLKEIQAEGAVAIALDPKTGGVLALVSLPSYDNNVFSNKPPHQKIGSGGKDENAIKEILQDEKRPLFNRAISGIGYPSGSTIKPLIASAALEEKIITPTKKINCQGKIVVENPWYDPEDPESGQKEWIYHDWTTHHWTDLRKAIAQSCNVYFYHIGGGYGDIKGLGAEKIKEYLRLFGWGEKTGIDLPGEGKGILPEIDKDWTLGSTYHLSIGQGPFTVTPLQVVTAFSAIANGGKLLKPHVVKKVIDIHKNTILENKPKIIRENFIDPENLQVVREGMRETVTAGSATGWLDSLPVSAAAKTGTAQIEKPDTYHNWITVFAPYDAPEIVLTVVILNVKDVRVAALPVARDILEWYFATK